MFSFYEHLLSLYFSVFLSPPLPINDFPRGCGANEAGTPPRRIACQSQRRLCVVWCLFMGHLRYGRDSFSLRFLFPPMRVNEPRGVANSLYELKCKFARCLCLTTGGVNILMRPTKRNGCCRHKDGRKSRCRSPVYYRSVRLFRYFIEARLLKAECWI